MSQTVAISDDAFCQACGACCDGTILSFGKLADDDPILPEMQPHADEDGEGFSQPCACFDGICKVYDRRPRVCRSYACGLLKALRAGSVTRAEADRHLADLRAAQSALIDVLPDAAQNVPLAMKAFTEQFRAYPDMATFMADNAPTIAAMRTMQTHIDCFRHGPRSML